MAEQDRSRGGADRRGGPRRRGAQNASTSAGKGRAGAGERRGSGTGGTRNGGAPRDGRGGRGGRGRDDRPPRTPDQQRYDGPPLPDEVSARDLDRQVRQALGSLPEKLADKVARHLVMAGALIDSDPAQAHEHALAARSRASRVAAVREACGETAYAAGKFAEALSDLRAARRMNGAWGYLPMIADCERALGRPERALALATPQAREGLDDAGRAELSIVVAGARRDLGQGEAAIRLLEAERLHSPAREAWVARLRYAYADALESAGRRDDALEWFHRVLAVDGNEETDAVDRIASLEGTSHPDR